MIRNTRAARLVLAATFAAVAAPVLAQSSDPSSGPSSSWSFEVGAGTDNRSKAASKSGNNGYVSAYAARESADGLIYVSPGFQTIQAGGSNIETDWIVGYRLRPSVTPSTSTSLTSAASMSRPAMTPTAWS